MTERHPPKRWEISDTERAQAVSAQKPWSVRDAVRLLIRSPRLVPEAARLALRSVRQGIWNDTELAVLLDSERVRQTLPDAVRGAHWFPDQTFLDVLLPRLSPDARALELGCGVGRISRRAAPAVRELVCTDISAVMLSEARENLRNHGNVEFSQTHGFALSGFADGGFDVVFAHAVFFFFDLYQSISLLDEARRVLRPGGLCVISFLTIDRPVWARQAVHNARTSAARGAVSARQFRPYAGAQVLAMFEAVGLHVADSGYGSVDDPDRHTPLIVVGEAVARP